MGRDSGGDEGQVITFEPLSNKYVLQWVMMCGYRILDKNGKPVTPFWIDNKKIANYIVELIEEKKDVK